MVAGGVGHWGRLGQCHLSIRAALGKGPPTLTSQHDKPLEPKSWISAIHAYVPGKSKGADGKPLIKLSANENPLGTSAAALEARAHAAAPALYPDPDSKDLRAALGTLHGIPPRAS
jgi:histidinol-phosphate aminotransferase